ncbi:MAG: LysM peptidoglycan-binding domain-containing protein, partial [Acidimicrobiia bacterium]|nr:LysM peptidoglycan-binding domain-containing protein [Acidimicrobiia bacterium]
MVALLTSDPVFHLPRRLADHGGTPVARRSRPRHLNAVPSPKHAPGSVSPGADAGKLELPARSQRPVLSTTEISVIAAAVVLAIVFVGSFGSMQAPPAQATWAAVNGSSSAVAPPEAGETVVLVKPGDTLWGLAASIAPTADRREVVQILAERNGGSTIWAGQDLIVPD